MSSKDSSRWHDRPLEVTKNWLENIKTKGMGLLKILMDAIGIHIQNMKMVKIPELSIFIQKAPNHGDVEDRKSTSSHIALRKFISVGDIATV